MEAYRRQALYEMSNAYYPIKRGVHLNPLEPPPPSPMLLDVRMCHSVIEQHCNIMHMMFI